MICSIIVNFFDCQSANPKQNLIIDSPAMKILILCFLILQLLIGCTTNDELPEDNFGSSVHHMISMQTSNPSKIAQGLDGRKAELIFQKYKSDVASPQEVDAKALGTQSAQQASQNQFDKFKLIKELFFV